MTIDQINQVLALLKIYWQNAFKDVTNADAKVMAEVYLKTFNKYSYEEMINVVERMAVKSKWLPSVAEIIEELEKVRTHELQLNANEEWEIVIQAVRKYGYYQPQEAFKMFKPFTERIIRHIGWNRICESDYEQMVWIKREFVELFENKKQSEYELLAMREEILTLNELMKLAEIKSRESNLLEE